MVIRLRAGRGAARAEDARGTPTHSHISPSILVYEDVDLTFFSPIVDGKRRCSKDGSHSPSAGQGFSGFNLAARPWLMGGINLTLLSMRWFESDPLVENTNL